MGYFTQLADSIGVAELALKLMMTVYAGYLFALIHRLIPFNSYKNLKLMYFIGTGSAMIYWNYGLDVYHSVLSILIQYLIFQVFGGTLVSVLISFIFQLGYLVNGYLFYSTTGYDINWCMPQCILTLRLIGLAFDVYDGHKKEEEVTKEQKERAIKDYPGLLEMFGFSYMYCGFIVGPQFPLQRFRDLLDGKFTDNPGHYPNSLVIGFRRGLSGTIILLVHVYLSAIFYPKYLTTNEYQNSEFLYKISYLYMVSFMGFWQYIAVWMVNEGVCIICGLGFRRDEKTEKIRWDAVRNVIFHKFLMARSFQDLINSFNLNTNSWVMRYVYKRLRFIGIREVSQACALLFLALWHGIHEGYLTCFVYEFIIINAERQLLAFFGKMELVKTMKESSSLSWIPWLCGFIYLKLFFGTCLIDFQLLKWHLYYPVHVSVHFYGLIFFGVVTVFFKLRPFFAKEKKGDAKKEN